MSDDHLIPLAGTQNINVRGAHPPSLTEALFPVKGQMYSEQEGGATPLSYFLKRGHKITEIVQKRRKLWEEEGARPDQTNNV